MHMPYRALYASTLGRLIYSDPITALMAGEAALLVLARVMLAIDVWLIGRRPQAQAT